MDCVNKDERRARDASSVEDGSILTVRKQRCISRFDVAADECADTRAHLSIAEKVRPPRVFATPKCFERSASSFVLTAGAQYGKSNYFAGIIDSQLARVL